MTKHILKSRYAQYLTNIRQYSSKDAPELPECDFEPKKYNGPSYDVMQSLRKKNLPGVLTTCYSKPLALHQGHKQWLFDIHGRRYLDMFGGICTVSVGHAHPKITEAVTDQISTLGHCSNLYFHPKIHEYAKHLTSTLPGDLKVVYFVNSGSEANDLAVLISRLYTRNFDIIAFQNGYHGMTYQTMGMSNTAGFKYPIPLPNGVHIVQNPDVYRGPWGGARCRDSPIQTNRSCNCEKGKCIAQDNYQYQLLDYLQHNLTKNSVAAFFAESIQGVGGVVQYPKKYIKRAFELTKQYGGLFVADEVQTGFGRTGDYFWGFQAHGIQPDIVTMAKGIGNGFPLGAVVTTPQIAAVLNKGKHFNTYGGNPVACAAGKAVLEVIEEENLQENSKEIGTYLLGKLATFRDKYKIVGDVRGKGLMIGVELILGEGHCNVLPNEDFMEIWQNCRDMGLIIGRGGNQGNVIRMKPPMCITKADADFTLAVLDRAFEDYTYRGLGKQKTFVTGL